MEKKDMLDPLSLWKEFYEQAEKNWGTALEKRMKDESFSQWMGQCLNFYLKYQELLKNSTEAILLQANIPTKDDLANLASLIIQVEEKIDDLNDRLDAIHSSSK